jgi:hypothetical protein
MSDNALASTNSRAFKAVLASVGARHIVTPPYTPRWNGKVCVSRSGVPSGWTARLPAPVGLTQAKGMSRTRRDRCFH